MVIVREGDWVIDLWIGKEKIEEDDEIDYGIVAEKERMEKQKKGRGHGQNAFC